MLNQSITSAIQYDNQSMQWENQFYQLIELNQCLWTHANQRLFVVSHYHYGSCFSLTTVEKLLTQSEFPQNKSLVLSYILKFPWHLAPNYETLARWHQIPFLAKSSPGPGRADWAALTSSLDALCLPFRIQHSVLPCYKSILSMFHKLTE